MAYYEKAFTDVDERDLIKDLDKIFMDEGYKARDKKEADFDDHRLYIRTFEKESSILKYMIGATLILHISDEIHLYLLMTGGDLPNHTRFDKNIIFREIETLEGRIEAITH